MTHPPLTGPAGSVAERDRESASPRPATGEVIHREVAMSNLARLAGGATLMVMTEPWPVGPGDRLAQRVGAPARGSGRRSPTTTRVEGSGRTVLACPTPSRKPH